MTALEIKKLHKPSPAGVLLISPWLDLEMKDTLHHPAITTDFLITFTKDNPSLVEKLLPQGMKPADPKVSPLFDDLRNLPPQLVITGGAEVLLPDSEKWVRKSKGAGNTVTYVVGQGQMHT
jgi:acetyl esterase/lipase